MWEARTFFRRAGQPFVLVYLQLLFVYRKKSFRNMSTNLGVRIQSQITRVYKEDRNEVFGQKN